MKAEQISEHTVRSGEIVRQLNPGVVAVCHGEPVVNPGAQIDAYLDANQAS